MGISKRHVVLMAVGLLEQASAAGEWAEVTDVDHLIAWMEAHPDHVSLVVGSVNDQGRLQPAFQHNPGQPRALASTIKVLPLGAMARLVSEGERSLDEAVSLADIERYYLAGTDGGAHEMALKELGLEVGQETTLTIDQVLRAMIRHSDNAATEWVYQQVGPERLTWAHQDGAMLSQEAPGSLIGMMLSWFNHDHPRIPTNATVTSWESLTPKERRERALAMVAQLEGPWLDQERAWRDAGPPLHDLRLQARLAATSPRGTATDYSRAMARVAAGFWHDEVTSEIMRRYLSWPMDNAAPDNFLGGLQTMGSKGGALPGVLTEASYYVPQDGPHAGETRVVVLFLGDLNVTTWASLMLGFHHQQLMAELATDPERLAQVQAALQP